MDKSPLQNNTVPAGTITNQFSKPIPNIVRTNKVTFNVGNDYRLLQTIGTGAYGVVCSAYQKSTDQNVAIKKIAHAFEIVTTAKRTLRELKLLLHFKHDNIVGVKNIIHYVGESSKIHDVYVVMDLMESDLHHVIRSHQTLSEDHICYFVYQLLRGLKYIHSANVIHRDLKPSNLLVNENCELKIGDFGMARGIANSPEDQRMFMTEYVATRWYRAPELMLSMAEYSKAIDMWSVGCIFAEMIGRKQLFPGNHYIHQLQLIISVLGSPSKKIVSSIRSQRVKSYVNGLPHKNPVPLQTLFPRVTDSMIFLLSNFLQFDPAARMTSEKALEHPFFSSYHDPADEPKCPQPFDFRFETAPSSSSFTKESVKDQVVSLIEDYHDKRNKLKKQLVFLPKSPSKLESPTSQNSKAEDIFKKPTCVPPAKQNLTKSKKSKQHINQDVAEPAEMMSAKETMPDEPTLPIFFTDIQPKEREGVGSNDIEMNSAKEPAVTQEKSILESKESSDAVGIPKTGEKSHGLKGCGKKTISESTKMLVRDTILASMLAKKNGLGKPPEKPKKTVTAAERQREREEKRRKRHERAAEKERKKREHDHGKKQELSSEDKSLLDRWTKMQATSKKKSQNSNTTSIVNNQVSEPSYVISDGKGNESELLTVLSASTLTRQNSLPNLSATMRLHSYSQASRDSARRWSGNLEMVQDHVSSRTKNFMQYVPTLTDIPPSPMNTTTQCVSKSGAFLPTQSIVTVVVQQSNATISEMNADKLADKYNENLNVTNDALQYQSSDSESAMHGAHCMQYSDTRNHPDSFQHYNNTNCEVCITDIPKTVPQVASVDAQTSMPLTRPNTLNTTSSQSENCSNVFSNPLSGLSATPPIIGLLPSSKSLVTLSPDTVDYVLNQELSRASDLAKEITADTINTFTLSNTKTSAQRVLTLSPGETSLVMKHASSSSSHSFGSKSTSIEFSPGSFLKELDKDRNQLQHYPSDSGADLRQESSKFLQNKNCSIMLSEAVAKNSDAMYINSNMPTNTSQIFSTGQDTFLNEGVGMVGGYGIGYEPDMDGMFSQTNQNLNLARHNYDMECDSAKSSSSLLNDWLEVSQMEEHDLEQLQKELELGSPMCIDDCGFKSNGM